MRSISRRRRCATARSSNGRRGSDSGFVRSPDPVSSPRSSSFALAISLARISTNSGNSIAPFRDVLASSTRRRHRSRASAGEAEDAERLAERLRADRARVLLVEQREARGEVAPVVARNLRAAAHAGRLRSHVATSAGSVASSRAAARGAMAHGAGIASDEPASEGGAGRRERRTPLRKGTTRGRRRTRATNPTRARARDEGDPGEGASAPWPDRRAASARRAAPRAE